MPCSSASSGGTSSEAEQVCCSRKKQQRSMYRSLYSYTPKEEGVLPFSAGEQFKFVEQLNEHWWKMQDSNGGVGLVPASYLVPLEYVSALGPSGTLIMYFCHL